MKRLTHKQQAALVRLAKAVAAGDVSAAAAVMSGLDEIVNKPKRKEHHNKHGRGARTTPPEERLEMCRELEQGGDLYRLCAERGVNFRWFRRKCWEPFQRMGALGIVASQARPRCRGLDNDRDIALVYEQWITDRAARKRGRKPRQRQLAQLSPNSELAISLAPRAEPVVHVVEFVSDYEELD